MSIATSICAVSIWFVGLKNVVFNNTQMNYKSVVLMADETALDVNDYLCIDNVTSNTTGGFFNLSTGNPVTALAFLKANCPGI